MPIPRSLGVARRPAFLSPRSGALSRALCLLSLAVGLSACGGGGSSSDASPQTPGPGPGKRYLVIQLHGRGSVVNTQGTLTCTASCHIELQSAAAITLRALPAPGEVFLGWGSACTGLSTTCTIRPDQDTQIDAHFSSAT